MAIILVRKVKKLRDKSLDGQIVGRDENQQEQSEMAESVSESLNGTELSVGFKNSNFNNSQNTTTKIRQYLFTMYPYHRYLHLLAAISLSSYDQQCHLNAIFSESRKSVKHMRNRRSIIENEYRNGQDGINIAYQGMENQLGSFSNSFTMQELNLLKNILKWDFCWPVIDQLLLKHRCGLNNQLQDGQLYQLSARKMYSQLVKKWNIRLVQSTNVIQYIQRFKIEMKNAESYESNEGNQSNRRNKRDNKNSNIAIQTNLNDDNKPIINNQNTIELEQNSNRLIKHTNSNQIASNNNNKPSNQQQYEQQSQSQQQYDQQEQNIPTDPLNPPINSKPSHPIPIPPPSPLQTFFTNQGNGRGLYSPISSNLFFQVAQMVRQVYRKMDQDARGGKWGKK